LVSETPLTASKNRPLLYPGTRRKSLSFTSDMDFARRIDGRLIIHPTPVRVRWSFDDLVTSDGHRLTAIFSASLRALPDAAEQKLFEETFLSGASSVSTDEVTAHFAPALRSAAAGFINQDIVEKALAKDARELWIDAFRAAGNAVAFACGIELLSPFDVEVTSPSLQRQRLEEMQRTLSERQTAGRVEHFHRAAELLKQWETLRASAPSITPGNLLEQLNSADRGAMLQTLLMASAGAGGQPDLWAVAGPWLVRIDVKGDSPQSQLIELPTTAGPLRSVNVVDGQVLVGARSGMIMVDPAKLNEPNVYLDPQLNSEHGFTRVTLVGENIWACHRDGGVVGWKIDQCDQPVVAIRPQEVGGAPKHLSRIGDRLIFAVENRLFTVGATPASPKAFGDAGVAATEITALLSHDGQLIVACDDGTIAIHDSHTLEKISESRPLGDLTGAALLPWLTSGRILLTSANGPINCVGLEDQLVTQYTSAHVGTRAVAGSVGKVAAMSADRQRIILWNTWDGRKPVGEIYLAGVTRHRVADIAFGMTNDETRMTNQ
jgi:hypothetical protein